eukprot:gene4548-4876_t
MQIRKTRDPFSTPARRRRIIADIAKATLKNYCIIACENVFRFRIETKAALIIQCFWRKYYAISLLRTLRFLRFTGASLKIQAIWRGKLARLQKNRLLEQLYLKKCRKLVRSVEQLYFQRKQRQYKHHLRQKRLERIKEQKKNAAITIQKLIRGVLARKRCHHLKLLYQKRRAAAITIQSKFKAFAQRKRYLRYRNQKFSASVIIHRYGLWWYRYKIRWRKKRKAVILIQSVIRMFISRRKVTYWKRMKYLLEKEQLTLSCMETSFRVVLTAYELSYNPLLTSFFPVLRTAQLITSTEVLQSESEILKSLLNWCKTIGLLECRDNFIHVGSVIEQIVHILLSATSAISPDQSLDNMITSIATTRPEKSYIITKKPQNIDRYEHVLKLLCPDLSFSHSNDLKPVQVTQNRRQTKGEINANEKLKNKRINSKTEMKENKDEENNLETESLRSSSFKEIVLEQWKPSSSQSSSPQKLPTYFNELCSINNSNGKRNKQFLMINRYQDEIEIKLIQTNIIQSTASSSEDKIISMQEIQRMKKGEKIEITKTKEEFKIVNIRIELRDDYQNQPIYSNLDKENNIPPFDEIIVSLPPSARGKNEMDVNEIRFRVALPEPIPPPLPPPTPPRSPRIIEVQAIEEPPIVIEEEQEEEEIVPEPSPPPSPPKVDYDHMARRIQRAASQRYELKTFAQRIIFYYYKTYTTIRKFRVVVEQAFVYFRPKVILLQSLIRRYLARKRFNELYDNLVQECNNFLSIPESFRHNFHDCNEYVNWKFFGMTKLFGNKEIPTSVTPFSEFEEPKKEQEEKHNGNEDSLSVIELSLPATFFQSFDRKNDSKLPIPPSSNSLENSVPPKGFPKETEFSEKSMSKPIITSISDNDFIPLVEMIQFPEIPPNCLLPFATSKERTVLVAYQPKNLQLFESTETEKELAERERKFKEIQEKQKENEKESELDAASDGMEGLSEVEALSGKLNSIKEESEINEEAFFDIQKGVNDEILGNLVTKNRIYLHCGEKGVDEVGAFSFGLLDVNEFSTDMKRGLIDALKRYQQQQISLEDQDFTFLENDNLYQQFDRSNMSVHLDSAEAFYLKLLKNFI